MIMTKAIRAYRMFFGNPKLPEVAEEILVKTMAVFGPGHIN
jgi:hypothetical protein